MFFESLSKLQIALILAGVYLAIGLIRGICRTRKWWQSGIQDKSFISDEFLDATLLWGLALISTIFMLILDLPGIVLSKLFSRSDDRKPYHPPSYFAERQSRRRL